MSHPRPLIVLIHGLGLKEGEQHEFDKWKSALDRGLADDARYAEADVRMAYYSAELHPEVHVVAEVSAQSRRRSAPAPLPTDSVAGIEEALTDLLEERFWKDVARQQRAEAAASPTAADALPPTPGRRRRSATTTAPVLTQLPDIEVRPGQPYRAFVRDVIKYFALQHRGPVNARLEAALVAAGPDQPILLVSHSLGTIVAYDVLLAGSFKLDTWITLGSPLGWVQRLQENLDGWLRDLDPERAVSIAEVGARIEDAVAWTKQMIDAARNRIEDVLAQFGTRRRVRRGTYVLPKPRYPSEAVTRWFNIYDPTDPVAAPPIFGDPRLVDKYLADDRERVYDIAITNRGGHPHSEVGYLHALQTVWLVKDFLQRQSRA